MSLSRYFANSKKSSDLSSEQSQTANDSRIMREDNSTTSFSEKDNVLLEGLKSDDCRSILANCFKNIQEKMKELFAMVRKK